MDYRDFLSKRSVVMAFAILWIMVYHMHITTGIAALDAFVGIGYVGSDIFYFVSGIGIWFSLERSKSLAEYYKKRFIRIMPIWWCFIGFWIAFRMIWFDLTWMEALLNVFAVESFFDIDRAFNWYISFLLVFYLLAPLIKKLIEVMPGALGTVLICVVFFVLGYYVVDDSNIMIGLARVPVFTLGMYFGSRLLRGRFSILETVMWLLLMPIGIYGVIYYGLDFMAGWHNGMLWYPLLLSVVGIYMIIAFIFLVLPDGVGLPFDFIGRHTLSIYLIHIFFFEIYERYFLGLKAVTPAWWHWIVIWAAVPVGCVALEGVTKLFTHRGDMV